MREIIPRTNNPSTKANCSKIIIESGDGSYPKASVVSIILNSGENKEIYNGKAWRNINAILILKIVLIFILIDILVYY